MLADLTDSVTAASHLGPQVDALGRPRGRHPPLGNKMLALETRLARGLLAFCDVGSWFVAALVLLIAKYDFELTPSQWSFALTYVTIAAGLHLLAGAGLKLYRGVARIGSFLEAGLVTLIVTAVALGVGIGAATLGGDNQPRGILVAVPSLALLVALGARFMFRVVRGYTLRRQRASQQEPVIVYGAGNAGIQLGRLLLDDPDAPFRVVGFIDDDPAKRNLHLVEGRVIGVGSDLVAKARKLGASTVVLAITRVDTAFMSGLSHELDEADITLLVLPPVKDIVGGRVQLAQLHEFDVADLLGRTPIEIDLAEIAGYLTGKVVLVTGAGGSIGSEIARQVHAFDPKELVCLDRDESALHAVQLSIYGKGLLDTPDMVLCDIRDQEALERVFALHRPDVVFHAAALKHLPMLEQYPEEGWKTNVLGTLNVLECAADYRVKHFVNISTDKAADATSILGKTKRKAEELTSWFAEAGHGSYVSVRFGNVLGSRGSVLFTFYEQIRQGGPVTVVHPEITRFFMTIPEACQLVIQAGAIGDPGDVMVLDMGEPVKILDVARRLIRKSGKQVDITFTGLRPGEKMHEVLFSSGEEADSTEHPLIRRVHVPAIQPNVVRRLQPPQSPLSPSRMTEVDEGIGARA